MFRWMNLSVRQASCLDPVWSLSRASARALWWKPLNRGIIRRFAKRWRRNNHAGAPPFPYKICPAYFTNPPMDLASSRWENGATSFRAYGLELTAFRWDNHHRDRYSTVSYLPHRYPDAETGTTAFIFGNSAILIQHNYRMMHSLSSASIVIEWLYRLAGQKQGETFILPLLFGPIKLTQHYMVVVQLYLARKSFHTGSLLSMCGCRVITLVISAGSST